MHTEKLTNSEISVLNLVRRNSKPIKKSEISDTTDMPWASVCRVIENLEKQFLIESNEENKAVAINSSLGYFVGVSVGSSNVKICIVDSNLQFLSREFIINAFYKCSMHGYFEAFLKDNGFEEYKDDYENDKFARWCAKTPVDDGLKIVNLIENILKFVLRINQLGIKVLNVGVSLSGYVNDDDRPILRPLNTRVKLSKYNIEQLIEKEILKEYTTNNIEIIFEHNVKAAAIAEIETKDSISKDFAVLYLGAGLGASFVFNGKLYRGSNNIAGQIGHSTVQNHVKDTDELICACGRKNCLEELIRVQVFGNEQLLENSTANELKKWLDKNPEKGILFSKYLSDLICNIRMILGVDTIFFSGKLSTIYQAIEKPLKVLLMEKYCDGVAIIPSQFGEYSAAFGAAACSYFKYYNIPFGW